MPAFEEARAATGRPVEAVHLSLADQDYVVLYRWTSDFGGSTRIVTSEGTIGRA